MPSKSIQKQGRLRKLLDPHDDIQAVYDAHDCKLFYDDNCEVCDAYWLEQSKLARAV